jgi:hypothetical protein
MPSDKEPWSTDREYARSKADGRFPTVKRDELHMAGMSLASVSNLPQSAVPLDVSHAPGALLDFVTGAGLSNTGAQQLQSPEQDYQTTGTWL